MTVLLTSITFLLLVSVPGSSPFTCPLLRPLIAPPTLLYGTNRRARRLQNKEQRANKSRPKQFYEEVQSEDPDAVPLAKKGAPPPVPDDPTHAHSKMKDTQNEDVLRGASIVDAAPTEERPEVSTVVIDEATGIERIAQGKAVMDVVTRKAVVLSSMGPEYRMAQFSPGVPPDLRERHRFQNFYSGGIEVAAMVEKLREACVVSAKNETSGEETLQLPPHPQVSSNAIDFVLANRDLLGFRMKKTLGRLKLRAQSEFAKEEASSYRALWKHFITLEDHISAPFRQMVLDAEAKIGPNFGNLELKSFIGTELYERCASYVVLKGMVAHWEKKVRDADFFEKTPQTRDNFMEVLSTGDPKRYLPDPPIIFRLNDVTRVCAMAHKMTAQFVDDPELFDDLPPELRFIEKALAVKGGTALRKFMVEFCEQENITPEALREGMRRFDQQLENMQIDPYGDFKNTVGRLCEAMAVGTDEENDPYQTYLYNLDTNGPGYFQTYTFNHHKNSMVRFLDNAKNIQEGSVGPVEDVVGQLGREFKTIVGMPQGGVLTEKPDFVDEEGEYYRPPPKRALGRPHNLGWLELLDDEVPKGEAGAQDDTFESDNWREIQK